VDINAFYFNLRNAITQRRDVSGADFFVNAGGTKQKGIETSINYQVVRNDYSFVSDFTLWLSDTYNHFRYNDFKQLTNDYSGKQLPGIAPHTVAVGADLETKIHLFTHVNYFYSDKIALNDANAEYANAYHLLGLKLGYRIQPDKHFKAEVFVLGDNLLNQSYSLGNDINAAANRFYNAAAGISYQGGISLQYVF
jgi:iron complex outermembrane receptor protein